MKLDTVYVKKLRSIDNTELVSCGDFNVLIGKNNSGKSNMLSAIDTFFTCVKNSEFVALNPPIGDEIDFYNKDKSDAIEITLVFALTLSERDALIRGIVTEAPQLKNAVDGISPVLSLHATLKVVASPNKYGYISRLAIMSSSVIESQKTPLERVILKIGPDAANELYNRAVRMRQVQDDIVILQRLDPSGIHSAFDLYKREGRSRGIPPDLLFRQINYSDRPGREIRLTIEGIIEKAATFEEAQRELRALADKLQEDSEGIFQAPLKGKIDTFSGEQSSIPIYARDILRLIAEMRVLYLRERRKVIGREEAQKLLELKVRRGGTERLQNIQETVNSLLGVRIDAFQGETASTKVETSAELDVDNFLIQVNGSGIREALRLILDYEFEHPNILLVEEPEVHLHPALETAMMRYLKRISVDCQVFLTTHSTNFLDTGEMKNVYLFSKTTSTNSASELNSGLNDRVQALELNARVGGGELP